MLAVNSTERSEKHRTFSFHTKGFDFIFVSYLPSLNSRCSLSFVLAQFLSAIVCSFLRAEPVGIVMSRKSWCWCSINYTCLLLGQMPFGVVIGVAAGLHQISPIYKAHFYFRQVSRCLPFTGTLSLFCVYFILNKYYSHWKDGVLNFMEILSIKLAIIIK